MADRDERAAVREVQRRYRDERARQIAIVQSIAICFVSMLVGVLVFGYVAAYLVATAGAALAVARVGPDALGRSFGRGPRPVDLLAGTIGAAVSLFVAFLYLGVVADRFPSVAGADWAWPPAMLLLSLSILPAFLEEWTCRGALWMLCRRVIGRRATWAVTSVLFGLLHAPAWGWGGVPTRVLSGLVFGELRLRTGGLAAPVLAHLLNNLVAAGYMTALTLS